MVKKYHKTFFSTASVVLMVLSFSPAWAGILGD